MNAILKGGAVLGICALITKLIGALYRIPLTNLLGADGIGIYQTVFPFYIVLLTVSSSGLPSAISKLVAEGKNPKKVVYKSIIAFGGIGFIGSFAMLFCSDFIAKAQGNLSAGICYRAISPSVFLVALLSVLRGYHQGLGNMKPTGYSQIIEQLVKLCVGLALVNFLSKNSADGAFYAVLAVTVSEVFALIFILVYKKPKINLKNTLDVRYSEIFKTVLPITISSITLPLCRVCDSFLVINILKTYRMDGLNLYGIYTGNVESIIGVPVSICYGLAVSALPMISKNKEGKESARLLFYTLIISVIFGAGVYIFGETAINLLYKSLSTPEKITAVNLLKISSVSVVLLPTLQASTMILIGKNKLYAPTISMLFGLVFKVILTIILVKIPKVNVYGTAFSDIGCYFVATFLNLLYIIKVRNSKKVLRPVVCKTVGREI